MSHDSAESIVVRLAPRRKGHLLNTWAGDRLETTDYLPVYVANQDVAKLFNLVTVHPRDVEAHNKFFKARKLKELEQKLEKERREFKGEYLNDRFCSSDELQRIEQAYFDAEDAYEAALKQVRAEAEQKWEEHQGAASKL